MRSHVRSVAFLVVCVLLLWLPRLEGPIDLRWDAGVYYVLGTSLAEGRGYRLLNEPGEIEAVQYPPALPLLVALVQKLAGTSDSIVVGRALRGLYFALSLALALAAYALARAFVAPGLSLVAALLVVLHPETYFLSDLCFSEIPYALVGVLFVLSARREWLLRAGALGSLAVLLRSPGVALLGAWVAEALLRRRPKLALQKAALSLVPLLLWGAYVARVTTSPAYEAVSYPYQRAGYQYYNVSYAENLRLADPFRPEAGRLTAGGLGRRLAAGAARMPLRLGEAVSATELVWWNVLFRPLGGRLGPGLVGDLMVALRAALGLLVIGGLALLALRGEWLVPLAVLGGVLLVAITPWTGQWPRYLVPLAPLLALGLVVAADGLSRLPGRWGLVARGAAGLAIAVAFVVQGHGLYYSFVDEHRTAEHADRSGRRAASRLFYYDEEWRALDRAFDWLGAHAEPDAVVATTTPHRLFLRTGRKAVMPPMEEDAGKAQRLLESVPARYVVEDRLDAPDIAPRYLAPAVRSHPARWRKVYEADGVRIHRLVGGE